MQLAIEMFDAPRARVRDPITSHEAAQRASRFAGSHAGRIHEYMTQFLGGGDGATAEQISRATGLTVVQIDRRLPEMQRAGLVRVIQIDGKDWTVNGFRVWEAA